MVLPPDPFAEASQSAARHLNQERFEPAQFTLFILHAIIRTQARDTGCSVDSLPEISGLVDQLTILGLCSAPDSALRNCLHFIPFQWPGIGHQLDKIIVSLFRRVLENPPQVGIKRPVQPQFTGQRRRANAIRVNAQFRQRPGEGRDHAVIHRWTR